MSMFAGANVINHATGWLEGGLVTGYEKTIIDADLCGKLASFFEGIDLSPNAQAMEAILEVDPGAHFLSSAHTILEQRTHNRISVRRSTNQWSADGALDTAERANKRWKQLLAEYEVPALIRPSTRRYRSSMPTAKQACPISTISKWNRASRPLYPASFFLMRWNHG
jgi:trimethylamine--corrinoid protein Co-methyltransferase